MKFEFTSTWMEIFHLVWEILVMRESNRNRNSKVKRKNSFTSSKQESLSAKYFDTRSTSYTVYIYCGNLKRYFRFQAGRCFLNSLFALVIA